MDLFKSNLLRYEKFKTFIGPQSYRVFWSLIGCGILWFLVDISFVFVIQSFLFSLGVVDKSTIQVPGWMASSVYTGILLFGVFGISRALVLGLRSFLTGLLLQAFVLFQRGKIFRTVLEKKTLRASSDIITLYSERAAYAGAVVVALASLILSVLVVIPFVAIGIYLAAKEFIFGMILFSLAIYPIVIFNTRLNKIGVSLGQESRNVYNVLLNAIKNRFLIWIYKTEELEVANAKDKMRSQYSKHREQFLISSYKSGYTLFVGALVVVIVSWVSVSYLKTPGIKLLGIFYIFIRLGNIAVEINSYLSEVRAYWPALVEVHAATKHLDSYEVSLNKAIKRSPVNSLELCNASYGYVSENLVFSDISFSVSKGDILLIKGRSGVGKSTLLGVILGLFQPRSGHLNVNGIKTASLLDNFSESMAFVGPDPFIFPGTVRENLAYGLSTIPEDEKIWGALRAVEISEIVEKMGGLDIFLNEDVQMSTGQKQRLSIARALIREPDILILDEATANLDLDTEYKIIDVLEKLRKSLILIIVSHKDTFDKVATQRLLL